MNDHVADTGGQVWMPACPDAQSTNIEAFRHYVNSARGLQLSSYESLWQWSVNDVAQFWSSVWEFFDLPELPSDMPALISERMPGARWFPGARLNYAGQMLESRSGGGAAIIEVSESAEGRAISWDELRDQVAGLACTLRDMGVRSGDRVVGYLPNTAAAVVGFLACASIGAIWSVCGQDYSAAGAAARFAQLDPAVLIAADGYLHANRVHGRQRDVADLVRQLPSLRGKIAVSVLGSATPLGFLDWDEAVQLGEKRALDAEQVSFDHPLWVLFTSGTTGPPKGIVHGHGGVLLEHLSVLGLELDIREGDRFLWYTTTNWMMWNLQVSALLTGATIVLYDGSPSAPATSRLWEAASAENVTFLGTSPGYLAQCQREGLAPAARMDLSELRTIGSTGSPLPAGAYEYVREAVGRDVRLVSASGGTDVVGPFAGCPPTVPIYAGEISAPSLGVALDAWDEDGRPVRDRVGELVVTKPMPSMPLGIWKDKDDRKLKATYFSQYPGFWRHGDWITITSRGSIVVHGRSDATLNRHGVRLGTAEIYAAVEAVPGVAEALVVGVEEPDGGYWMPLFVVCPNRELDEALRAEIRQAIRTSASPRHIPDEIIQVQAIPHTRTGKKLEVPVKRVLQGVGLADVVQEAAVDNPESLRAFAAIRAARRRRAVEQPSIPT